MNDQSLSNEMLRPHEVRDHKAKARGMRELMQFAGVSDPVAFGGLVMECKGAGHVL